MVNCYINRGILLILFLVSSTYVVNAQKVDRGGRDSSMKQSEQAQQTYKIKIVDEYGEELFGVKVFTADGKLLTTSVEDGVTSISIPAGIDKIDITHPGYYTERIHVGRVGTVKMVVNYLAKSGDVKVLYDTKARSEVLGAVSSVNNSQITTTPTSLYLHALTGRLPGFYTQVSSGFRSARTAAVTANDLAGSLPTDATKYSSSLNDNSEVYYNLRGQQPVTLIDGVQRDIYSIDPESIESITVAKDALSSLLLGQRSSRGILQITTKKGVAGAPRISFTAQTGIQNPLKTPTPLSAYQYAYLYNEALLNSGRSPAYSQEEFDSFRNGSSPLTNPNVNWYDAVLKDDAPVTKYHLGVNGGMKNARYALSLSYLNQEGMFQSADAFSYDTNLELNRYLINSSIEVDVTENLNLGLQIFGRIQDGRQPGAGTSAILDALYTTPNNAYPIFNDDGTYGGSSTYPTNLYQQVTGSGYLLDDNRDLMANLDFKYQFDNWLPGLYAKGKVNVSATSSSLIDRSRRQPVYDVRYNDEGTATYVRFGSISDQPNSFSTTSTANFFYVQGVLGYDVTDERGHSVDGKLFVDQQTSNYQFDLPAKYTNIAATGNYNFQNKYFVEAAINYSGFNRFQPGHRYGLFYAAGLGWDVAKESFIKDNVDWINQLKLRATYGKTGNTNEAALGYYSWRASYGQDGNNGYDFGSEYSYINGIIEKGLANVAATWEKAHKVNLGLDWTGFDSHLKLTADFYRDEYYDLLQQRGSTIELMGIGYPNENIGRNLFSGQEVSLTYQNNFNTLHYFITINASRMKTEVLYMNELRQAYSWNKRTGMPVGQTFGYLADGFIQTQEEADNAPRIGGAEVYPGDIKLRDLNNDGIINLYDQTALGNTEPIIYYGATVGFNIKGFDFSILLQGVKNRSYQQTDYSFGSNGERQGYDYLLGRWTPETATTATYPRLTLGFNANNTPFLNNSSFWTRSGEYFRIRNIDIGYTIPYAITNKLRVAGLRFFANAQNLYTSTAYDRLDPEVYGNTAYPMQRVFNVGVNIKL